MVVVDVPTERTGENKKKTYQHFTYPTWLLKLNLLHPVSFLRTLSKWDPGCFFGLEWGYHRWISCRQTRRWSLSKMAQVIAGSFRVVNELMGEMRDQVYKTPVVHRGGFAPVGFGQSKNKWKQQIDGAEVVWRSQKDSARYIYWYDMTGLYIWSWIKAKPWKPIFGSGLVPSVAACFRKCIGDNLQPCMRVICVLG